VVEVVILNCCLCYKEKRYLGVSEWAGRTFDDAMSKAQGIDGWVFIQASDGQVRDLCNACAEHLHSILDIEMGKRRKKS
jgi:hypothetical protein